MSDDSIIDDDEAGLAAIGDAIGNLARRERKPSDLATLIAAGGLSLEIVASADPDDLCDAASDYALAQALSACAGLALTARQALRHYCGVRAESPNEYQRRKAEMLADNEADQ